MAVKLLHTRSITASEALAATTTRLGTHLSDPQPILCVDVFYQQASFGIAPVRRDVCRVIVLLHLPTWRTNTRLFGYGGAAFEGGIRLIHLWFLYYLLMLYGIALIVRWVFVRWFDSNANLRKKLDVCVLKLVESQFGVVWLSLPIGLVIYWMNNDLGLRTPEVGFRPDLLSVLAYGIMFALGWLLHRQTRLLSILRQRFVQYLIAGSLLTLGPFYIMITGSHDGLAARTVHAALCSLAMVLLTFGFTGLFLRYCSGYRPTVRYLSDASYWLYIVHLPLVGALQVALSQLPWHWSLKFILILLVSVPLLLLSYQYLVRYTWIGRLLNGPRRRGELHEKPPPAARFESTPTLSAG